MNKKIIIVGIVILILVVLAGAATIVISQNKTEENENNALNNTNNTENNQMENQVINETEENATINVPNTSQGNIQNTNVSNSKKSLVIYYSRSGNTKQIADYIGEKTGSDVIRLETVKTYPSDYDEMLDYAQEEQRNGERPEIKNKNINTKDYDTIFLGYPIWWGDIATPVYTFLDEYNLSGKKIAPFVTSGSSGLSGTPSDIKREEPNAEILDAMSITSSTLNNYKSLTDNWLSKLGF